MGCGCTPAQSIEHVYIHTKPNGEEVTYNSEYEAKAAVLRGGGNWRAVPKT